MKSISFLFTVLGPVFPAFEPNLATFRCKILVFAKSGIWKGPLTKTAKSPLWQSRIDGTVRDARDDWARAGCPCGD